MSPRPEFSICTSVNTPPARVAAALAPLAALDAQIVLAIDDRVDAAWIEGYRQIADRVLLIPFPGNFARLYAWLREQCTGRWIVPARPRRGPGRRPGGRAAGDDRRPQPDARVGAAPLAVPRRIELPGAVAVAAGLRAAPAAKRTRAPALPGAAAQPRARDRALPLPAIASLSRRSACRTTPRRAPARRSRTSARCPASSSTACRPTRSTTGRSGAPTCGWTPSASRTPRSSRPFSTPMPATACRLRCDARGLRTCGPCKRDEIERLSEARSLGDDAYRARLTLLDDDLRIVSGERRTLRRRGPQRRQPRCGPAGWRRCR